MMKKDPAKLTQAYLPKTLENVPKVYVVLWYWNDSLLTYIGSIYHIIIFTWSITVWT